MDAVEVQLTLYKNITNLAELKEKIESDKLEATLVNPKYIFSADQLLFAAHRSLLSERSQQLKTKTIFTEVLYNLSPNRKIRDALKTFGVQQEDVWSIRAVVVTFAKCNESYEEISRQVQGKRLSMDDISEVNDVNSIRKLYKVSDDLTEDEEILNCILTRMASKDVF